MLFKIMKESTKITLINVKEGCRRKNSEANNKLHWFSSKFSIYFSYIFIKLRFTADQVTIIFFLIGLFGVFSYGFNSLSLSILGYMLFRLHIIIDMSDGDVARFNQSFSIRGAYWDAVIHAILNPLYYIFICFSFYLQFDNNLFIVIGALLGLSSSVLMSVKNNYFKAMLSNGMSLTKNVVLDSPVEKKPNIKKNIKYKSIYFLSEILSIEGFIFLAVFVRLFDKELFAYILLFIYLFSNILITAVKFYQFSYNGKTFTKA